MARMSLKAARITSEIGLKQLAIGMGVTVNTISNWERGRTEISAWQFEKLLGLMGLTWEHVEPPRKEGK